VYSLQCPYQTLTTQCKISATLRAQRWARISRVQARLLDRDREERESGGFEDEDREDDESGDSASLDDEAN
jgi:hypothetical protein